MTLCAALLVPALYTAPHAGAAAPPDWESVRREERFRKHGALSAGSRVTLGPVDRDNWNSEQARYVGMQTRVVELVPDPDSRGCYGVRVEADGAVFFWRVRNLAGEGLRSGKFLSCERLDGTGIPLCVVPMSQDIPLYDAPSADAETSRQVPMFTTSEDSPWRLPRHLFVHERSGGFLHVMESDFGSRDTLGWVREEDTIVWPTRQGYMVNTAPGTSPPAGYAEPEDVGRPERAVVQDQPADLAPRDPNQTGMCDGLLLQRRMVRGMELVQCAWTPPGESTRQILWFPASQRPQTLVPYVLMSEYDLIQLSAEFALLYAACMKGYVDEIRDALEQEWDLEAKVMTGTKEKARKYAQFYREVQSIYPALSRRLELPPGQTEEAEFAQIAERAAESQARVQRIIDSMLRDQRSWSWVRVDTL